MYNNKNRIYACFYKHQIKQAEKEKPDDKDAEYINSLFDCNNCKATIQ